jgi:predicted phage terminase large subunit-like protein
VSVTSETIIVQDFDPETGDSRGIQAYRVNFANNRRITALTSRPRNLRGKQGCVIIDEAAFHDDLPELMKAALALLMWGGKIEVISTHDGAGNPFAELVADARAGKLPYSLHRVTLDDALDQGLYRRICLVSGTTWSPEAQEKWRADLVRQYGRGANEELFCIPSKGGDALFQRHWFTVVDAAPARIVSIARAWDLAGTEVDRKKKNDPDWTRGVKGGLLEDNRILITNVASLRGSPGRVRALLRNTAEHDGAACQIGLWQDPGQAGKAQAEDLVGHLLGFAVAVERAAKDKISYAEPISSAAENGRILIVRAPWNEEFLAELEAFPDGQHDDHVDALSRLFQVLTGVRFAFGYDGLSDDRHGDRGRGPTWGNDDDDDFAPSGAARGYF